MLAVLPRVAENPDMVDKKIYDIAVTVQTRFLNEQSAPDDNRYVFAYSIRIANAGSVPARLLTRH